MIMNMKKPSETTSRTIAGSQTLSWMDEFRAVEIVIGLVGRISAGVSTTAEQLGILLTDQSTSNYDVHLIKMSDFLVDHLKTVSQELEGKYQNTADYEGWAKVNRQAYPFTEVTAREPDRKKWSKSLTRAQKTRILQDVGNALRNKDRAWLAAECVQYIAQQRERWAKTFLPDGAEYDASRAFERAYDENIAGHRRVYIIDSLKNPAEAQLLRHTYGDRFYLFAVLASEEVLEERRRGDSLSFNEATKIAERDHYEDFPQGQNVRDTAVLADVFVRNDSKSKIELRASLERYVNILFGSGIHAPSVDETAMQHAASAAVRSTCLSRQVGASLISSSNELLAVGWNEAPRAGGGLYLNPHDTQGRVGAAFDGRCFAFDGFCRNDAEKGAISKEIAASLRQAFAEERSDIDIEAIASIIEHRLSTSRLKDLIEFSRAVHAEMAAILQVAREGREGLIGSTLYCTTYPCHNCARHIIAAGISKVVYIEPYPKSLAPKLHKDAISSSSSDGGDKKAAESKVIFVPFDGVAPRNMIRFFESGGKRKDDSGVCNVKSSLGRPKLAPFRVSTETLEGGIISQMGSKEGDQQ